MAMNDGLGSLSEDCLEASNKDIQNYLQFLYRKNLLHCYVQNAWMFWPVVLAPFKQ